MKLSIMEDYHPNKQSVVESPKEQTDDESQPEQLIGVLQSVGEASQYEKWHEAAAERKCKSHSEKELRLLKKGGVDHLQEYKREESKQRQLQPKKQKKEDDVRKRMETAGNASLATTAGELPLKKKKNRKLQRHKPSSSAAVNQLKQANKESSVEAKEEKAATRYYRRWGGGRGQKASSGTKVGTK